MKSEDLSQDASGKDASGRDAVGKINIKSYILDMSAKTFIM